MKKNIKTILISIPDAATLKLINNTPALKSLSRSVLMIGDNIENVNHYQFSKIQRMFCAAGCNIKDITK